APGLIVPRCRAGGSGTSRKATAHRKAAGKSHTHVQGIALPRAKGILIGVGVACSRLISSCVISHDCSKASDSEVVNDKPCYRLLQRTNKDAIGDCQKQLPCWVQAGQE